MNKSDIPSSHISIEVFGEQTHEKHGTFQVIGVHVPEVSHSLFFPITAWKQMSITQQKAWADAYRRALHEAISQSFTLVAQECLPKLERENGD